MKSLVVAMGFLLSGLGSSADLPHEDARRIDHLARSWDLERVGDLEGAMAEARRSVFDEKNRASLEAVARLGERMKQRDPATDALRRLALLVPTDPRPWLWLARLHVDAGELETGLSVATEATRRDPTSTDAFHWRGLIALRQGDLKQAMADFEQTIFLSPSHRWALNNLGYARILSGQYERAIEPLARACRLAPHLALAHNNLGVAYEHVGRLREAQEAYGKAMALDRLDVRLSANFMRVSRLLAGSQVDADGQNGSDWESHEQDFVDVNASGMAINWVLGGASVRAADEPAGADLLIEQGPVQVASPSGTEPLGRARE
jgi:Flp pilus assembly protein TadD